MAKWRCPRCGVAWLRDLLGEQCWYCHQPGVPGDIGPGSSTFEHLPHTGPLLTREEAEAIV